MKNRADIVEHCVTTVHDDGETTHVLAVVDQNQLAASAARASSIRTSSSRRSACAACSKYHEQHPFVFGNASVGYEPAEAATKIKGGNSNWRGPVWFPTTFLMIESLRKLEKAYSGTVRVALRDGHDCPSPRPATPPSSTRAPTKASAPAARPRAAA